MALDFTASLVYCQAMSDPDHDARAIELLRADAIRWRAQCLAALDVAHALTVQLAARDATLAARTDEIRRMSRAGVTAS
jgi:hypothetical protein